MGPISIRGRFPDGVTVVEEIKSAKDFDLVILATAHKECIAIDWESLFSRMRNPILYDGRRVLNLQKMRDIGWIVNAIGSPTVYSAGE